MTRIAVVSDVHADVDALQDALAQAERLGCDIVLCAGDLVDSGRYPERTVVLLRARAIPCIRGNHDRWALKAEADDDPDLALSASVLAFLRTLPPTWAKTIDGVRVVMWHARPGSDMNGIEPQLVTGAELGRLLDKAEADVLVVGHTHRAWRLEISGGRCVVNPGALLRNPKETVDDVALVLDPATWKFEPGPPPTRGTFGVLELPSRVFTVHRAADGAEVEIVRTVKW